MKLYKDVIRVLEEDIGGQLPASTATAPGAGDFAIRKQIRVLSKC